MKRIILLWVLLPQMLYAQYQAEEFMPEKGCEVNYRCLNAQIRCDSVFNVDIPNRISGLFMSGTASLQDDPESYIRVTLKDRNNAEYLVYENYPILSDALNSRLNKIALESCLLDDIIATSIKIELKKAAIDIDSIFFTPAQELREGFLTKAMAVRHDQSQYIVDKLNAHLRAHGKTWRAGITSISQKSFEEMKSMFGGHVPMLYGFEHYKGGVFVMPSAENKTMDSHRNNYYVSEWDWRNRHGKNWVTPAKDQGNCASCWAFSASGAIEAYTNLYYNQLINYTLSEQELLSCSGGGSCVSGGYVYRALDYIGSHGVVLSECFGYEGDMVSCNEKCSNPSELISLDEEPYDYLWFQIDEDTIKRSVFKRPLCFEIRSWWHAIVLIGYKTLEIGDCVYSNQNERVIISPNDSLLIGKTAWLFKNSRGDNWGENGFGYVIVDIDDIKRICAPKGFVYSQIFHNTDIVCEDADGDGYFNWGVGDRPSHCPVWAPIEEDGDDSDPSKGPLTNYGFTTSITPSSTIYIDIDTQYSSGYQHILQNICVRNNSTFTVSCDLSMNRLAEIRIKSGSTLIVEGVIRNANIKAEPGSTIILKNGGQIITHKLDDFVVPVGVILQINEGRII